MKYKISVYARLNKVTYRTVWNWVNAGKVEYIKTSTGSILIVEVVEHKDRIARNPSSL